MLSVIVVPGPSGSKVNILMGADLLGRGYRPPVGTLGIRLRSGDLVGLAPANAALKALLHVVRTLEHVVQQQRTAEGPGAPLGATGGTVTTLEVPGQMMLPMSAV